MGSYIMPKVDGRQHRVLNDTRTCTEHILLDVDERHGAPKRCDSEEELKNNGDDPECLCVFK